MGLTPAEQAVVTAAMLNGDLRRKTYGGLYRWELGQSRFPCVDLLEVLELIRVARFNFGLSCDYAALLATYDRRGVDNPATTD